MNYMIDTENAIKELPNISPSSIGKLREFFEFLQSLEKIASKNTHYDRLDDWNAHVDKFVHKALKEYGFKNGDAEHNDKHPDIRFWWYIYGIVGSIYLSPNLETAGERHHSSAYDRNMALEVEVKHILDSRRP